MTEFANFFDSLKLKLCVHIINRSIDFLHYDKNQSKGCIL